MCIESCFCNYWSAITEIFFALTGIKNVEPRTYLNKSCLGTQEVSIKYQVSFRWAIISGEKYCQEISSSYSCKMSMYSCETCTWQDICFTT